ncbi:MAG: restriction endonuclease subunit S [Candidatus Accumulibacter sp.]|uniref:restriction endonuclease subunit S n=1 Tax=Accumulibacter sp. TaxID=2053492 RepID=UPI001ACE11CC|nr:restriction endonuclease subunit S [Accumulibacter sp.]MBN8517305.1 restriction endonuclease subunit S [Accumulibacter sp.]MBO3709346.1 restriction endonuclease subunit S [Accumulibacter sp.]
MNFVPLVKVADVQLGKMLSPKAKTGSNYFRYLRNTNIQWGRFELSDLAQMDFSEAERKKFELRYGDLLVCEGGEPGRCVVWRNEVADCYYQKALHRVRPHDGKADSEFLGLWIRHQAITGAFEDQNAKTTIAHLPQVRLEQLLIPDAGITEQRQIATRLKAQLAEVETARQAARVQVRDAELLRQRLLRLTFDSLHNAPCKVLGEWARTTSGTTPPRGDRRYWSPAEIPWVKTGEVAFAPIMRTEESISRQALAECSLTLLPPQTVLIAMYGQGKTRGQSAILEIEAATNQACFAVLPNETWDAGFLHYWLMASYDDLRGLSDGRGGNQANLKGGLLSALEVPAPDVGEQRRIVTRLKSQLAETDAIAEAAAAQLAEIERLPQRLLAQAFNTEGTTA